jgi:uncharacterized protein
MDLTKHPSGKGLTFPCDYALIVMGPATDQFRDEIEQALTRAGAVRLAAATQTKLSAGGKYQSLTIPVRVQTRAELEHLYIAVQTHPDLKFRL